MRTEQKQESKSPPPVPGTGTSFEINSKTSRYFIIDQPQSYEQARLSCLRMDRYLAIPYDEAENDKIRARLQPRGKASITWLGVTDADRDGLWEGADGRKMRFRKFDNFGPTGDSDAVCVGMSDFFDLWKDEKCDKKFPSVCGPRSKKLYKKRISTPVKLPQKQVLAVKKKI